MAAASQDDNSLSSCWGLPEYQELAWLALLTEDILTPEDEDLKSRELTAQAQSSRQSLNTDVPTAPRSDLCMMRLYEPNLLQIFSERVLQGL